MDENPYSAPNVANVSIVRRKPWKRFLALGFLMLFLLNHVTVSIEQLYKFYNSHVGLVPIAGDVIPFLAVAVSYFYVVGKQPQRWKRFWEAIPYMLVLYVGFGITTVIRETSMDEVERAAQLVAIAVFYLPVTYWCARYAIQQAVDGGS